MVIIYGLKKKIKVEKNLGYGVCPRCHHNVERSLGKEKTYPTLYHIPIFVWTSKHVVLCPCCGDSELLTSAQYKQIKNA